MVFGIVIVTGWILTETEDLTGICGHSSTHEMGIMIMQWIDGITMMKIF